MVGHSKQAFFQGTLKLEQCGFTIQSTGIAGKRAISADNAMAGHDDTDRVAPHRSPHGPNRCRLANALTDVAVTGRFTQRYG